MSNKEKILERLEMEYPNTLTSLEISDKTGINIDMLYVYLNDLNNKRKVVRVNNKKPYQYIAITPKALLKQLYDIMDTKMKPINPLNEMEIKSLNIIMELIK